MSSHTSGASSAPHFHWGEVDSNHVLPLRGDGIRPEDDLGEDGDYGDLDLGEAAAAADCDGGCGDTADGGLKDGALRLTGGHDDTEVSWSPARVTCHVSRVTCPCAG